MPDTFLTALREWQNFYLLVGTAAATLVGLLFVALSLESSLVLADRAWAVRTFMTPSLIIITAVLMVTAVSNMPIGPPGILGLL
jgi:heme O synthase-like polyprenyltransferase